LVDNILRPFGGSKINKIDSTTSNTTTTTAAKKYNLRYAAELLKFDKIQFIKTEGLTFALLAGPMGQAASMCRFRGCRYKNKNKNSKQQQQQQQQEHHQQQQQQQQTPSHSPQIQHHSEVIPATTGEKVAEKKSFGHVSNLHKYFVTQNFRTNNAGKQQETKRTEKNKRAYFIPRSFPPFPPNPNPLPLFRFSAFQLPNIDPNGSKKMVLFCTFANFQFAFGCTQKQQCHLHTGPCMYATEHLQIYGVLCVEHTLYMVILSIIS